MSRKRTRKESQPAALDEDIHPPDLTVKELHQQLRARDVEPSQGANMRRVDWVYQLQGVLHEASRQGKRLKTVHSSAAACKDADSKKTAASLPMLPGDVSCLIAQFLALSQIGMLARVCGRLRAVLSLRLTRTPTTIFGKVPTLFLERLRISSEERTQICRRFCGVRHAELGVVREKQWLAFCQSNGHCLETVSFIPVNLDESLDWTLAKGLAYCPKLVSLTVVTPSSLYRTSTTQTPEKLAARNKPVQQTFPSVQTLSFDCSHLRDGIDRIFALFPNVTSLTLENHIALTSERQPVSVGERMTKLRLLNLEGIRPSAEYHSWEEPVAITLNSQALQNLHTLAVGSRRIHWCHPMGAVGKYVPAAPPANVHTLILPCNTLYKSWAVVDKGLPASTQVLVLRHADAEVAPSMLLNFSQVHTLVLEGSDLDTYLVRSRLFTHLLHRFDARSDMGSDYVAWIKRDDTGLVSRVLPRLRFLDVGFHAGYSGALDVRTPHAAHCNRGDASKKTGGPCTACLIAEAKALLDAAEGAKTARAGLLIRTRFHCSKPVDGHMCEICPRLGHAPSLHQLGLTEPAPPSDSE